MGPFSLGLIILAAVGFFYSNFEVGGPSVSAYCTLSDVWEAQTAESTLIIPLMIVGVIATPIIPLAFTLERGLKRLNFDQISSVYI